MTNQRNQNQQKNGKDDEKVTPLHQQKSETKEVMEEIKEINVHKNSNEYDLEIAKKIVDGTVKKTELKTMTEREKEKLRHEAELKHLEVDERLKMREMELNAKSRNIKNISEATIWIGGIAAVAVTSILNTKSHNNVKLEKIRQGHFE